MKSAKLIIALFVTAAFCRIADAAPRTSGNYSITAEALAGGGARVQSANYQIDASIGDVIGISTAPESTVKHGYAGQLYDLIALRVTGPSSDALNENASRQLQVVPLADDLTTLAPLDSSTVEWSIVSGPVASVSPTGLATAAHVYVDSPAAVAGSALGLRGQWSFAVLNVSLDDYKAYGGDGIDDAWQVGHFGEENPSAGPLVDADGDGHNNLFEYTAGLVPTDANSVFRLRIENVPGEPTQRRLIFSPRLDDRTYTPQFRTSLTSGAWDRLTGATQRDNGSERTVTDSNATEASKFYRIEIAKP